MTILNKCLVIFTIAAVYSRGQTPTNQGPRDPGPRGGPAGAGGALVGLPPALQTIFLTGQTNFQEVEDVSDGLGPRFNSNSCVSCHIQPAVGGSSPASNPQLAFANSQNRLP